jgi:hypothetical protein
MAMGPPLMPPDYHRSADRSGDISVLQDRQSDVSNTLILPKLGLAMEKHRHALLTKPAVGSPGYQVLAVTSTHLADGSPPPAAMTDSRPLVTEGAVLCHMSLSPLNEDRWENSSKMIAISAARRTQGVPWLCVPPSREVCPFRLRQAKNDLLTWTSQALGQLACSFNQTATQPIPTEGS